MEASVGLGVGDESSAGFVLLGGLEEVVLHAVGEVVVVDEVVARVVGRVDVDHLDLAEVGLLQELEDFEVVALDVEVFRLLEIHALGFAGAQRLVDGRVGGGDGFALAGPVERVALDGAFDDAAGKLLAQEIEIDGTAGLALVVPALGDAVGEKRGDFLDVGLREVGGTHLGFGHGGLLVQLFGEASKDGKAASICSIRKWAKLQKLGSTAVGTRGLSRRAFRRERESRVMKSGGTSPFRYPGKTAS